MNIKEEVFIIVTHTILFLITASNTNFRLYSSVFSNIIPISIWKTLHSAAKDDINQSSKVIYKCSVYTLPNPVMNVCFQSSL